MNVDEILKLIDAGYTKSEIDAMTAEKAEKPREQPAKSEQPEASVVDDKPEQPEAPVVDDKTEKRLEKIESILSQIAANGIANSTAPEPQEKRNVVAEVVEHL